MYRGEIRRTRIPRQRTVYSLQFLLKIRSPCERAQSLCDEYNIFILNPPTDLLLRIGAGFVQLISESETIVVRLPEATATATTLATVQHGVMIV